MFNSLCFKTSTHLFNMFLYYINEYKSSWYSFPNSFTKVFFVSISEERLRDAVVELGISYPESGPGSVVLVVEVVVVVVVIVVLQSLQLRQDVAFSGPGDKLKCKIIKIKTKTYYQLLLRLVCLSDRCTRREGVRFEKPGHKNAIKHIKLLLFSRPQLHPSKEFVQNPKDPHMPPRTSNKCDSF